MRVQYLMAGAGLSQRRALQVLGRLRTRRTETDCSKLWQELRTITTASTTMTFWDIRRTLQACYARPTHLSLPALNHSDLELLCYPITVTALDTGPPCSSGHTAPDSSPGKRKWPFGTAIQMFTQDPPRSTTLIPFALVRDRAQRLIIPFVLAKELGDRADERSLWLFFNTAFAEAEYEDDISEVPYAGQLPGSSVTFSMVKLDVLTWPDQAARPMESKQGHASRELRCNIAEEEVITSKLCIHDRL